jgi:threonine dehydrogenase-like Zn-dependent dehydrogenase
MDGKIDVKPVITDIFSIEEWEKAFGRVAARKRGKVLFRF